MKASSVTQAAPTAKVAALYKPPKTVVAASQVASPSALASRLPFPDSFYEPAERKLISGSHRVLTGVTVGVYLFKDRYAEFCEPFRSIPPLECKTTVVSKPDPLGVLGSSFANAQVFMSIAFTVAALAIKRLGKTDPPLPPLEAELATAPMGVPSAPE
ncbi:hypothetical protein ATCC90586_004909 [Pythium insidiosum]|nr:hypothetical protein ATCC90586_004909 [Pythium insidiosum]